MKLKKLVEDHGLPLKVRIKQWREGVWVELHYEYGDIYYGHNSRQNSVGYLVYDDQDWQLYKEPCKHKNIQTIQRGFKFFDGCLYNGPSGLFCEDCYQRLKPAGGWVAAEEE